MKKLLLALTFILFAQGAWAQNPTCPTRPSGDNTNACASTAFVEAAIGGGGTQRTRATANVTFNINTGGTDSGQCLTVGTACATLDYAWNTVAVRQYDFSGYIPTFQFSCASPPCTFAGAILAPLLSADTPILLGDTTTPANVLMTTASGNLLSLGKLGGAPVQIKLAGIKFTTTAAGADAVVAFDGSFVTISDNVEFGSTIGDHISLRRGAHLIVAHSYLISGGGGRHMFGQQNTVTNFNVSSTIATLSGSPVFTTAFTEQNLASTFNLGGVAVYSGAAGSPTIKFKCLGTTSIQTPSGANTLFPGTVNGTPGTGCYAP